MRGVEEGTYYADINMSRSPRSVSHFTNMGFAVLTNKGNIYRMMNKNPITIGNSFHKFVRIDERDDFTSLTILQGTDGSQQFYLAVTQSGRHYYSKDLESWTFQSVVPLPK